MRGIILAGGDHPGLRPLTTATPAALLPIGDKPMIYYPLSLLLSAGVREVLVLAGPADLPSIRGLLGDGAQLGLRMVLHRQPSDLGGCLALARGEFGDGPLAVIRGDNFFHGADLPATLRERAGRGPGCRLFGYPVRGPARHDVAVLRDGEPVALTRGPATSSADRVVTGLYLYDDAGTALAARLGAEGGPVDATRLHRACLDRGDLAMIDLGRGFAWIDIDDVEALHAAGSYVHSLAHRTRTRIGCVEEAALSSGLIDAATCDELGRAIGASGYGRYVRDVAGAAMAAAGGLAVGAP